MNKVAAFALRRKNSILSMSEKLFCPPQPLRFWITPACAGKRRSDWIIRSIYWDHPRVCGEKCPPGKFFFMTVGSPPRVRGKAVEMKLAGTVHGITPACAGKSSSGRIRRSQGWDHPRVCGEKVSSPVLSTDLKGSPPRMRGKGAFFEVLNTAQKDHPRACGEKVSSPVLSTDLKGSPPRMRGKADGAGGRAALGRITPACAGKSFLALPKIREIGDHPRVCGEKPFPQLESTVPPGSPPRVRGKACNPFSTSRRSRDHPRMCGEKLF